MQASIGDRSNRSVEYDALGPEYSQFLLDELLPAMGAEFGLNPSQAPEDRGIAGGSSGGICAFSVGRHRPDRAARTTSTTSNWLEANTAMAAALARQYPSLRLHIRVQLLQ